MKTKLLKRTALLLCALIAGMSSVWAADPETITFSDQGYSNGDQVATVTGTNCTITFAKGTNSNSPKYYTSGTAIRAYGGNTMTVSSENETISKIEIAFGSSDGTNDITTDVETYSNGTWTGSSQSVVFTIGGSSGNRRLSSVKVTYIAAAGTTAAPTISGTTPFVGSTEVTITNASTATGATIYYTTDGTDPTTSSSTYSAPFTINATTTVKAIAKAESDDNASSVVSQTFTKVEPKANIAALSSAATSTSATDYVTLDGAVVTFVNGNYAYIEDASGAIVYYKSGHGLTAGQVLSGTAQATYILNSSNPRITDLTDYETANGEAPSPTAVAQADWSYTFSDVLNKYMKITNATITTTSNKYYVSLNDEDVQLYGQGDAYGFSLSDLTKKYDIVGFPTMYNSTKEIQIFAVPTEKTKEATVITVTNGTNQTVNRNNNEESLTLSATASSGQTVTFAIASTTLTEGTDFDFANGEFLFYTTKAGTITVTASSDATDDYEAGEETITITVQGVKQEAVISYDGATGERVKVGATYVIDEDLIEGGAITVTSSDAAVASVDGLTITGVAAGTATITIETAANDVYNAGSGSFTLTVYEPAASNLALTGAPVALTFDLFNNASAQVINYTTSGTGAVTVIESDYATFVVDESAKTITVTPTAATPSAQTITVSQAADDDYNAGNVTFTVSISDSTPETTFELVTDVNDLAEGDVITLVNESAGRALGTQSTNNFGATEVTISDHSFILPEGVTVLTLASSASYWLLKTSSTDYLYAASSSSNYMRTKNIAAGNGITDDVKASISISNGDATIKFDHTNNEITRNWIQYNSSSKLFSCYSSAQAAIQIYKKAKYANTITVTNGTTQTLTRTDAASDELQLAATATDGTVTFAVKSATGLIEDTDFTFENGKITLKGTGSGTIVITASCAETTQYKAADDVDITVNVVGTSKSDPTIAVSDDEVTYGTDYVLNTAGFASGTISISSSNTAIATVNNETLTITPVAVGEVTITVNTAESSQYNAGSATFELTVNAPEGTETAPNSTANMDFTSNSWNLPTTDTSTETTYTSGNYSVTLAGSGTHKFSSSYLMLKSGGTLTFQAFDKVVTNIEIIGNSGASGKTEENIYVGETEVSTATTGSTGINSFDISRDYQTVGTIYTLKVTEANAQITGINVTFEPTETVTLNGSGYATYCSVNPLDFSGSLDATVRYSAWQITGVSGSVITFERITGAIKGGQGVLLKGETGGATVTIPLASSTTELEGNKLVGTTAPTYFDANSFYGLSGDKLYLNAACTLPAGKAYLPASEVSNVKSFTFVFVDSETGITETQTVGREEAATIFDLSGRRMTKVQKGIFIINGKKVVK